MNSRKFLLASEFIGAVIETIKMRVNLIQFTLNRAYTNLAGIVDPKKEVGTDALSAKVRKVDEYELGLKTQVLNQMLQNVRNLSHLRLLYKMAAGGVAVNKENSGLQLLRQIPISIQIITAGKKFPQKG